MNISLGHNITTYRVLFYIFLAITIGIFVFDRVVKKESFTSLNRKQAKEMAKVLEKREAASKKLNESEKVLALRSYKTSLEQISPVVLQKVTGISNANEFEITSFRPQKPADNGPLSQITYVISGSGSFSNTMNVIRSIEDGMQKLTVSQIQLASNDGAADTVNATIYLTAFVAKAKVEQGAKKNGQA